MKAQKHYNKQETHENLKEIIEKAETFECLKFKFTLDSAIKCYEYATGEGGAFGFGGPHIYPSSSDWDQMLKILTEVPVDDRPKIRVFVFKHEEQTGWLFGGGHAGFLFTLNNVPIGTMIWDAFIS